MYYYRKSTKNDYEDDMRNLNNKIDIIYSLLEMLLKIEMIYQYCLILE